MEGVAEIAGGPATRIEALQAAIQAADASEFASGAAVDALFTSYATNSPSDCGRKRETQAEAAAAAPNQRRGSLHPTR